jgi:hypothetical protein
LEREQLWELHATLHSLWSRKLHQKFNNHSYQLVSFFWFHTW